MKKDFLNWIQGADASTLLETTLHEKDFDKNLYLVDIKDFESVWKAGQKEFLKGLLAELDKDVEKNFGKYNKAKGRKAQNIADAEAVKAWLLGKYHYLKRRNDE